LYSVLIFIRGIILPLFATVQFILQLILGSIGKSSSPFFCPQVLPFSPFLGIQPCA
jgi:hypothetical protein